MKWLAAGIVSLFIGVVGTSAAQAQNSPVIVELYTSQGCSSCPPADALMHKLVARPDVIALSLHVDYWDYIGWKDQFADPANADRQRAYARVAHRRSIYTPQMIIGGVDSVVGAHPMDVADLIAKHARKAQPVTLRTTRSGSSANIAAQASRPADYQVYVAKFDPERTIKIKRGENAGKTLTYANVVSALTLVGTWNGASDLSMTVQIGRGPAAVFIQKAGYGPIDAAAMIR